MLCEKQHEFFQCILLFGSYQTNYKGYEAKDSLLHFDTNNYRNKQNKASCAEMFASNLQKPTHGVQKKQKIKIMLIMK